MTERPAWYRPDQSVPGRSNTITHKVAGSKVYLHFEFDHNGDPKAARVSQPQKFRDTQVEAILNGMAELFTQELEACRQRRAG